MINLFIILIVIVVAIVSTVTAVGPDIFYTTGQRIEGYGYPVESHEVQTIDGYVLKMFRIPDSSKEQNDTKYPRPIAFIQHGILGSSDDFIMNGPDNALAYLFADAGFDVWLANIRGNTYSRKNVNISPDDSKFWQFSFHEFGTRDLPAMIDYVLQETNQEKLHYVGHSQGTTAYFVLMSEIPSYNGKIKTAHMLAPIAFVENAKTPIGLIGGPLLGHPSILSELFEGHELLPNYDIIAIFGSIACVDGSWLQRMCSVGGGWESKNLNHTLLPQVVESHPAGTSTNSVIHFSQEYESGYFRQYDHGKEKNIAMYGQSSPPNYTVNNIVSPVRFYYSDSDLFASVIDVKRMENLLPNLVESYEVPVSGWTHSDFLWAINVKEFINDKIINTTSHYEKTGEQL